MGLSCLKPGMILADSTCSGSQMHLTIKLKGLILVLTPFALLTGFFIWGASILLDLRDTLTNLYHLNQLYRHLTIVTSSCVTHTSNAGGYVMTTPPRDQNFLRHFNETDETIQKEHPHLIKDVASLPADCRLALKGPVQVYEQSAEQLHSYCSQAIKLKQDGKLDEAREMILGPNIDHLWYPARSAIFHMFGVLKTLANVQEAHLRLVVSHLIFYASSFIGAFAVFCLLLWVWFSRDISDRLRLMRDNTVRLSRQLPLHPIVAGNDEIADVDRSFHDAANGLYEATRKQTAIFDNAKDVICSVNSSGDFVRVNPASKGMWDYDPEELLGRKFTELMIDEDQEPVWQTFQLIQQAAGNSSNFESAIRRKDGKVVFTDWSAYWSDMEQVMYCVAHDVTERKLAEEAVKASEARIRNMIDQMLVSLIVISENGTIEMINPSTEQMFGASKNDLVGKPVGTLLSDGETSDNLLSRALNRIAEVEAKKSNGERFPIELTISPFEDPSYAGRYLINILDVSERREIERLRREFVSMVSHELRTPLTSIRGGLTLLSVGALGDLPEKAKDIVKLAERNSVRLIGLINDLLDIEKLEAGMLEMQIETCQLADIIQRSTESVKTFAEERTVKIKTTSTMLSVHGDRDRLVQVLVNLLSNAIKFSPPDGNVTIGVDVTGDLATVSVTDEGRGIPAAYRELIFQRFQQVTASDAKQKGGSGLGLAICKAIIELHHGTIAVDSEEGKGSKFWFTVPLAADTVNVSQSNSEARMEMSEVPAS
jgi:PAS domain S-box-containing protein